MILIPKYKVKPVQGKLIKTMGVGGEFRCLLRDLNGNVVRDTGWFKNLITDYGLDTSFGTNNWPNYFHVGSSNTAPGVSDTTLGAWMAYSSINPGGDSRVNGGSPNYEATHIVGRRFAAGVATGTIREIGLSHLTTNSSMAIRTLVSPEIVKAADQILDIFYRFKLYPDLTDDTGVVVVDSISYNYTCRFGYVNYFTYAMIQFAPNSSSIHQYISAGALNGLTTAIGTPHVAGTAVTGITIGTANVQWTSNWSVDNVTSTGFIVSAETRIYTPSVNAPRLKVGFDAVVGGGGIPKDLTEEFHITWQLAWTRH